VISYLRTLTTWHCPPLLQRSIDISCPPGPQQQTCSSGFAAAAAGLLLCALAGTDGHRTVPQILPCTLRAAVPLNEKEQICQ